MSSFETPQWAGALVSKCGGRDLRLITRKSLKSSDLDVQHQHRLLLPSDSVESNLIPMLSEDEKATANLLHPVARRNMPHMTTGRVQGRKHEGLEILVYSRSGHWWKPILSRWDSTGSTVIKGPEYKKLLIWSSFKENDVVELWGFRQGQEGKLCFALGKRA